MKNGLGAFFFIAATAAFGAGDTQLSLPKGYIVSPETISPDHHYGVTVFDDTNNDVPYETDKNKLIDMETGRVVAVIDAMPIMMRMNNISLLPSKWSPDGSLMLWQVDGKWTMFETVLLEIQDGKEKAQINVLKVAQTAILERTRKAAPQKFAAAKKANAGSGSAFPEGFTVEVEVDDPIGFPLHVRSELTSNPKGIGSIPPLTSHMEGDMDAQGGFKVTKFGLGAASPSHFD